jgi:hypothetical protein
MVSSLRVPLVACQSRFHRDEPDGEQVPRSARVARQSRFHRDEPDGEQLAVWAPSEADSDSA